MLSARHRFLSEPSSSSSSSSAARATANLELEGIVSTSRTVSLPYRLLLEKPQALVMRDVEDRKLHVAFVIDKSGSMHRDGLGPVAQAMHNVTASTQAPEIQSSQYFYDAVLDEGDEPESSGTTMEVDDLSGANTGTSIAPSVLNYNPSAAVPPIATPSPIELAKQVGTDMITDLLNMRARVRGFSLVEFSESELASIQSVDLEQPDFFQQLAMLNAHVLNITANGQTYLFPALEKMREHFRQSNVPAGTRIILFVATDGAISDSAVDIPRAIKMSLDPDSLYEFTVYHFRIGEARHQRTAENAYFSRLAAPNQLHYDTITDFQEIPARVLNAWAHEMDAPQHRMTVDVQFLDSKGAIICKDTAQPGCLPYGNSYSNSITLTVNDFQKIHCVNFQICLGDTELLRKTIAKEELDALEITMPDARADAMMAATIRKFWAALVNPTLKMENALYTRLKKLAMDLNNDLPRDCHETKRDQARNLTKVLRRYKTYVESEPMSEMREFFNSVMTQCSATMSSQSIPGVYSAAAAASAASTSAARSISPLLLPANRAYHHGKPTRLFSQYLSDTDDEEDEDQPGTKRRPK